MVFESKIKSRGNEYWILIHSVRKDSKIIHKTKYIGKVLPPKKRLEQLKKEFLIELNEGRYKYFSKEDVNEIEEKKKDYKDKLKQLSKTERENNLKEFMIRFTYDSSKLAGIPITLRQTSLILKEGIVPKDLKSLSTIKKLENQKKGFMLITQYKGKLDIKFLKKLHKVLLAEIEDEISGKLRSELGKNVALTGTTYVPPKWNELEKELIEFFKWYKRENKKLHAIELAALVHLKLISIQPFVDGNSRLSRLLMNWILWKKGYPLIDIPIEDLEEYYGNLDKYQIGKNEKPFVSYIKKKYLK